MGKLKRHIVIHVTEEFSKQNDGLANYIFPYDECNIEFKNVGSKQMFLVSKEDGENILLIDVDVVMAIDYERYFDF